MKNVPRQKLWKQRAIFTMIRSTVEELRVKMHNSRVTLYIKYTSLVTKHFGGYIQENNRIDCKLTDNF